MKIRKFILVVSSYIVAQKVLYLCYILYDIRYINIQCFKKRDHTDMKNSIVDVEKNH